MKFFKLNRKHHGYGKWNFAIDFGRRKKDHKVLTKYARAFEKLYGPSHVFNPDYSMFVRSDYFIFNESWYRSDKRGRIYFNNESDITAITLMVGPT